MTQDEPQRLGSSALWVCTWSGFQGWTYFTTFEAYIILQEHSTFSFIFLWRYQKQTFHLQPTHIELLLLTMHQKVLSMDYLIAFSQHVQQYNYVLLFPPYKLENKDSESLILSTLWKCTTKSNPVLPRVKSIPHPPPAPVAQPDFFLQKKSSSCFDDVEDDNHFLISTVLSEVYIS